MQVPRLLRLISFLCVFASGAHAASLPPGVIINRSPDFENVYVACPAIAALADGELIASHSWFGPGTTNDTTEVFSSKDRGRSWQHLSTLKGQWWSTLFVHRGALYLLGVNREYGNIVVRRSTDRGKSWTVPIDARSGLLTAKPGYHGAPVPIALYGGRIWRAFELSGGLATDLAEEIASQQGSGGYNTGLWGDLFIRPRMSWPSLVLSAADDADLLKADEWLLSEPLHHPESHSQWIEGNVIAAPDGTLVNVLRTNPRTSAGTPSRTSTSVAILKVSSDGRSQSWDPTHSIVDFPGGGTKFTIRYDEKSQRYWSLPNLQTDPAVFRNVVALASSSDLRDWRVERVILEHPDAKNHAWQYLDWIFDGADLIAVSRTAWDGSKASHDANYFTFHRIEDFRTLSAR